jgi:prolyl-tRNA synthetase
MSKQLPDFNTQFSDWYNEIIYQAELADFSPVRGCIVIRPYGYAIWENIKEILDKKIKDTGHQNAAFPLFIPMSFLEKEAEHVAGFAPELAVVTHAGGKELEEPLVVRPTSETIIHFMYAEWLKSWRDLPIKINQWANVVRWEMRTRPFLRTTEFFWQEGHTAHETAQQAEDEALTMLNEYKDLYERFLAIPATDGIKSESEKFAGADKTYTIEGMMPDGKALQMCTSHLISQNFAKSFGMTFQNREGAVAYPYLTSWGLTTRSVGAVIMVHGDQKGLVLPPAVAPIQVVIIPIVTRSGNKEEILQAAQNITDQLAKKYRVYLDTDAHETPGAKFFKWELKGVPLRIEIGPRDIANGTIMLSDRLGLAKESVPLAALANNDVIGKRLELFHQELFNRAKKRLENQWFKFAKLSEFAKSMDEKGGFYQTGWCRSELCETQLKEYKATIRCLLKSNEFKHCFACNKVSVSDILVARAY